MNQVREMVIANQNETVRKQASQENVFLATIGLMGCVGVIFYNPEHGMVSLTHVDANTDFSFMAQEQSWVGRPCQVFIIKNKADLHIPVHAVLTALGISDVKLMDSTEGTVVFNHRKGAPQIFKMQDFINLSTPGLVPAADNKLHQLGYHPTFSVSRLEILQKRTYERQLNAAASKIASNYPLLVHQETGWVPTSYSLASDVQANIEKGLVNSARSVAYVWPRYQQLLAALNQSTEASKLELSL